MDYGQTRDSQVLPGLLTGPHRPTIKGLYRGQIRLVNELQKKLLLTVIGDFVHIVNITKPGNNRH